MKKIRERVPSYIVHRTAGARRDVRARMVGVMLLLVSQAALSRETADYAVQLDVQTRSSPPEISLTWTRDSEQNSTGYVVSRKSRHDSAWETLGTLDGSATSYTDATVEVGRGYEYQVQRMATGYGGYGYVFAGIELPAVHFRGKLVLVVDVSQSETLGFELARLESDLAGEGWEVLRHDVARTDSVEAVKSVIRTEYEADPGNVRAVFLFGRVPVPYSGNIAPDGHLPDHQGAWPADVYYAEMDGGWTDVAVNTIKASNARHHNVPGDGRFDQSQIPGQPELEIGRVDLSSLPAFARSETELLRQYLNKNHAFRHKLRNPARKALVVDNFGTFNGEAFAASAWRNFPALLGRASIETGSAGSFLSALTGSSFLWAYGCGPGTYTSAAGIGTVDSFAAANPQAEFTFLFGSYFGDWDSSNNLLRSVLAWPEAGLTSGWAGRPHWFVHHMGLGETIGYSTLVTQRNASTYKQGNYGARFVHIALMGDPSLRLHPVAPPINANALTGSQTVTLRWSAAPDEVWGYHVYRASSANGPFKRIHDSLVQETEFTDANPGVGVHHYMIRAEKLEIAASGSYFNLSQGAFATATVAPDADTPVAPHDPNPEPEPPRDPAPPTVAIRIEAPQNTVAESAEEIVRLLVTADRVLDADTDLALEIAGSAESGKDFAPIASTVRITAGTDQAAIELRLFWDYAIEPTETVIVSLATRPGVSLVENKASATVSILDTPKGGSIKLRRR